MISFVTTPTDHWLEQNLSSCSSRFLVSNPYIGDYLTKAISNLSHQVHKTLLTRTDLRDFAAGSSDVEALCAIAAGGTTILSLSGLHAKVYVVGNKRALVTSANATQSGIRRNWECGVAFDDEAQVEEIAKLVLAGFGASPAPQAWQLDELELLRAPVQTLRDELPPAKHLPQLAASQTAEIKLKRQARAVFVSKFSGWTQLALEGVLAQMNAEFTLDELMVLCQPLAVERFPENRFVREQVRKQLQRLRDLGLVEFLGDGNYRRTLNTNA